MSKQTLRSLRGRDFHPQHLFCIVSSLHNLRVTTEGLQASLRTRDTRSLLRYTSLYPQTNVTLVAAVTKCSPPFARQSRDTAIAYWPIRISRWSQLAVSTINIGLKARAKIRNGRSMWHATSIVYCHAFLDRV